MNTAEQDQLRTLFARLGASAAQAEIMAAQTQKRCDQLVEQRGLSRPDAMAHLLRLVTQGSQGIAPAGFEGVSNSEAPKQGQVSNESSV